MNPRPRVANPAVILAMVCAFIVIPARAALSFVQSFGTAGAGTAQFNAPSGVAIDGAGNIYVADENNNRIDRFNPADFAGTFTSFGTRGSSDGQFIHPNGIMLDGAGNLYVADLSNNRIVELSGAVPAPEPSSALLLAGIGSLAVRRCRRARSARLESSSC